MRAAQPTPESHRQRSPTLDGRLAEINGELAEEELRKARLGEVEESLKRVSMLRHAQEKALENIRKVIATLAEQRKLVENLARQLETLFERQEELRTRLGERQREQALYDQILARADEIHLAYSAWQNLRAELERWEEIAGRFREHEKRRQEPLVEIETARARLLQEKQSLEEEWRAVSSQLSSAAELTAQIEAEHALIESAEVDLAHRKQLDNELVSFRQRQAEARAQNPLLKRQMDEIKAHIDQLMVLESPVCPFCCQLLSEADRQRMIGELQIQRYCDG
jgi:exonuclease SbcC